MFSTIIIHLGAAVLKICSFLSSRAEVGVFHFLGPRTSEEALIKEKEVFHCNCGSEVKGHVTDDAASFMFQLNLKRKM